MKVLKFGGTSVGSAENINKVISILDQQSKNSKIIVVVSAVGGITDQLLEAANLACNKNLDFKDAYNAIWSRHNKVIEGLFAYSENDKSLQKDHEQLHDLISEKLKELSNLLDGIYLINELSPKTRDKLLSFGETLSSNIL